MVHKKRQTVIKAEPTNKLKDEEEELVPIPLDLWSDDSSFYGGEEIKAEYEKQVAAFNPLELWDVHEQNLQCIVAQEKAWAEGAPSGIKRKRDLEVPSDEVKQEEVDARNKKIKIEDSKSGSEVEAEASIATATPSPTNSKEPFNPYEDTATAYQLTETLDEFLTRLRPSETTIRAGPWIWIANPYSPRRHTSDDIGGFKQEGFRLIEDYMNHKHQIEDENPGKAPSTITRKLKPDRDYLESAIMRLAKEKHVTCGKWMLFPMPRDVDYVWSVVAKATLEGTLGCAAKVATDDGNSDKPERLICVYTEDFSDMQDVKRVLTEMKKLGLVKGGPEGRVMYYKCDAYTYLDIMSGNEYKLKASLYNSKDLK